VAERALTDPRLLADTGSGFQVVTATKHTMSGGMDFHVAYPPPMARYKVVGSRGGFWLESNVVEARPVPAAPSIVLREPVTSDDEATAPLLSHAPPGMTWAPRSGASGYVLLVGTRSTGQQSIVDRSVWEVETAESQPSYAWNGPARHVHMHGPAPLRPQTTYWVAVIGLDATGYGTTTSGQRWFRTP
jgi:hypothetical protein